MQMFSENNIGPLPPHQVQPSFIHEEVKFKENIKQLG